VVSLVNLTSEGYMSNQIVLISGKTDQVDRSDALKSLLTQLGFAFKEVIGVYKSTQERSFCVIANTNEIVNQLHGLSIDLNQECILVSSRHRESHLMFADRSELYVGKLVEVSKKVAVNSENYTIDGNSYYICR